MVPFVWIFSRISGAQLSLSKQLFCHYKHCCQHLSLRIPRMLLLHSRLVHWKIFASYHLLYLSTSNYCLALVTLPQTLFLLSLHFFNPELRGQQVLIYENIAYGLFLMGFSGECSEIACSWYSVSSLFSTSSVYSCVFPFCSSFPVSFQFPCCWWPIQQYIAESSHIWFCNSYTVCQLIFDIDIPMSGTKKFIGDVLALCYCQICCC